MAGGREGVSPSAKTRLTGLRIVSVAGHEVYPVVRAKAEKATIYV